MRKAIVRNENAIAPMFVVRYSDGSLMGSPAWTRAAHVSRAAVVGRTDVEAWSALRVAPRDGVVFPVEAVTVAFLRGKGSPTEHVVVWNGQRGYATGDACAHCGRAVWRVAIVGAPTSDEWIECGGMGEGACAAAQGDDEGVL